MHVYDTSWNSFKNNDDREEIREQCLHNQAAYHRISAQTLLAAPGEYLYI